MPIVYRHVHFIGSEAENVIRAKGHLDTSEGEYRRSICFREFSELAFNRLFIDVDNAGYEVGQDGPSQSQHLRHLVFNRRR